MSVLPISVAGIQTTPEPALQAVCDLAEASARRRGVSLVRSGLSLFEHCRPEPRELSAENDESSPFVLGRVYELMLAPAERRRSGTHLTPEAVARWLVGRLPIEDWRAHKVVLDPACGGGAFLLAAADAAVDAGADPQLVFDGLRGVDIDAGAIMVAEAALALWAIDHDLAVVEHRGLVVGDGLLTTLPESDVVVGNPPFLSQLRKASTNTPTRRKLLKHRWPDLMGTYTDDAWLFLAAGLDALTPGGALAMVQPVSVLGAKHGGSVRAHVAANATMHDLWVARDAVFDASVQVCGLVVKAEQPDQADPVPLQRWVGIGFEPCADLETQPAPQGWAAAAAVALGVPATALTHRSTGVVGDMASATAGFRDEYYGLIPHVSEVESESGVDDVRRLVTVGMIDPFELAWGQRSFRFAKQAVESPVVATDALRATNPRVASWVEQRHRPKVLVATQTRVVEVWVDLEGAAVPATPVVSVEPLSDNPDDLWMLAAALGSPAVSAHFVAAKFGTAMALDALKLAASDVLGTPMPVDEKHWRDGAELVQAFHRREAMSGGVGRLEALRRYAETMNLAYGLNDGHAQELTEWWLSRLPRRGGRPTLA